MDPVEETTRLPDGSGFFVASMPLPKDHWLTQEGENVPPAPLRVTAAARRTRDSWEQDIAEAARYAIRASTENGKITDFDPDAMVRNMIIGLIGYDGAPPVRP